MQTIKNMFFKDFDGIDPHKERIITTGSRGILAGLVPHSAFALLFLAVGLKWLVLLNTASVVQYVAYAQLIRRGRFHLGLFLVLLEGMFFTVISVYLVGWESGFYLWLVILGVILFLGYGWRTWFKMMLVCLFVFLLAGMAILFRKADPVYRLSPGIRDMIFYFNGLQIFLSAPIMMFIISRATEKAEREAYLAHQRSRNLLLNILPEKIADRLTGERQVIADTIRDCSILFSDLVGFTGLSSSMSAEELVGLLNELVTGFDQIVREHGLEKIKTIGDGYMAAAGVPEPCFDHAQRTVACGLEMLRYVERFNQLKGTEVLLRVGVNSGRVVAGVIGQDKFTYDLWGDAVNTASRMESHGVPGKVHFSGDTLRYLGGAYRTRPRGSVEIKGKGMMDTYTVETA